MSGKTTRLRQLEPDSATSRLRLLARLVLVGASMQVRRSEGERVWSQSISRTGTTTREHSVTGSPWAGLRPQPSEMGLSSPVRTWKSIAPVPSWAVMATWFAFPKVRQSSG